MNANSLKKSALYFNIFICLIAFILLIEFSIVGFYVYKMLTKKCKTCAFCGEIIYEEGWQYEDIWLHDHCEHKLNQWAGRFFGNAYSEKRFEFIYYMAIRDYEKMREVIK